MRLLVVEDNPVDVFWIQSQLREIRNETYEIVPTATLLHAFAKLDEESFDIILLDLGLPDSLGLETFTRMHKKTTRIPIIILSGNDDQDLAVEAVRMGAQDYLVKNTWDEMILCRSIAYAIARHEAAHSKNDGDLKGRNHS